MKRKKVWTLTGQVRESAQWLARNVTVVRDRARSKIEKELAKRDKDPRLGTAILMNSLDSVAIWEESTGAVAVVNGDLLGWQMMHTGFQKRSWGIRLRYSMEDERGDHAVLTRLREPHCLAQAIATREDGFADWFGQTLVRNLRASKGGDHGFYTIPFQPFVLNLYSLWRNAEIKFREDVADPLGPYQQVIDAWHDEGRLATALAAICDYHCDHAFDDPKGYREFVSSPFNFFPVEILAVERVRRDLGLGTPRIAHPLLESALMQVPATLSAVDDELLDKVIERARLDYPEIDRPPSPARLS